MTDETSQLLSDTAEKLFSDHVTKNCIIDAEKGTWPDELWSEVIANGFNLILVPEELGGVGAYNHPYLKYLLLSPVFQLVYLSFFFPKPLMSYQSSFIYLS